MNEYGKLMQEFAGLADVPHHKRKREQKLVYIVRNKT